MLLQNVTFIKTKNYVCQSNIKLLKINLIQFFGIMNFFVIIRISLLKNLRNNEKEHKKTRFLFNYIKNLTN